MVDKVKTVSQEEPTETVVRMQPTAEAVLEVLEDSTQMVLQAEHMVTSTVPVLFQEQPLVDLLHLVLVKVVLVEVQGRTTITPVEVQEVDTQVVQLLTMDQTTKVAAVDPSIQERTQ